MARFDDREMAALIKKYTRNNFTPFILPTPRFQPQSKTYEKTLEYVRQISENAVNRIHICR